MKNRMMLAAILAALAASGCQKQADAPVAPAAPEPASPAASTPGAPPGASYGGQPPRPLQRQYDSGSQYAQGAGVAAADLGVSVSSYPDLQPIPGYPVYYAPGVDANYFFYDGAYWIYHGDNWYASTWYNGPWMTVAPEAVPEFILRVPVHYYHRRPDYFRGWRDDAPPQWSVHWGSDWQRRRSGWDRWDHNNTPPPAPLPVYQRQFSGNRYPPPEQGRELHNQNYHYQPREAAAERVDRAQRAQEPQRPGAAEPQGRPQNVPQTPQGQDRRQVEQQQREQQQRESQQREQQQREQQRVQPHETQRPGPPPAVQQRPTPDLPHGDPPRRETPPGAQGRPPNDNRPEARSAVPQPPPARPPQPERRDASPSPPPREAPKQVEQPRPQPPREPPPARTSPERPQPPREAPQREEEKK
jgi:hypothetical protein